MVRHFLYFLLLLLIPVLNKSGSGNPAPSMNMQCDIYTLLKLAEKGLSGEVFQLGIDRDRREAHPGEEGYLLDLVGEGT